MRFPPYPSLLPVIQSIIASTILRLLVSLFVHVPSATALPLGSFVGQVEADHSATRGRRKSDARRRREFHLSRRQAFEGEQTVITVKETVGPDGRIFVETCEIRLFPIVSDDGEDLVRAESRCTTSVRPPQDDPPGTSSVASTGSATSSAAPTSTPASTGSARPTSVVTTDSGLSTASTASSDRSTTSAAARSTQADVTSTATSQRSTSTISTETLTESDSSTDVQTSATPSQSTSQTSASTSELTSSTPSETTTETQVSILSSLIPSQTSVTENAVSVIGVTTVTRTSSSTPLPTLLPSSASTVVPTSSPGVIITTSAPVSSPSPPPQSSSESMTMMKSSETTGAQLPGTKLEVKPIGLGIFAGLAVIVLVIVAIVMYERVRHRRIFRDRQAAQTQRFERLREQWK